MAAVMDNAQLTTIVMNMQMNLASMETTLNGILPQVTSDIATCAAQAQENLRRTNI